MGEIYLMRILFPGKDANQQLKYIEQLLGKLTPKDKTTLNSAFEENNIFFQREHLFFSFSMGGGSLRMVKLFVLIQFLLDLNILKFLKLYFHLNKKFPKFDYCCV